jgi:hypothetical protein
MASNGEFPNVEFPNVEFPNVEFPNVEFPNVEFPNVEFPNGEFPNVNSLTPGQIKRYIQLIKRKLNELSRKIEELDNQLPTATNLRNITKKLNDALSEEKKYKDYYIELIKKSPTKLNLYSSNSSGSSSSNSLSLPSSSSGTSISTANEYGYTPPKIPIHNNDPNVPSFGGKRRHKRSAKKLRSAKKHTRRTRRQKH